MKVIIQNKALNLNNQNTIVLFVNSNFDLKELSNSSLNLYIDQIKKEFYQLNFVNSKVPKN